MGSRLEKSVQAMAKFCPDLVYQGTTAEGGGLWRGPARPIRSSEGLDDLLDDIHHRRPVYAVGTELRHWNECRNQHCHHPWMNQVQDLSILSEIQIFYSGGRDHPKCWVPSPAIPPEKRRHHWSDGSICPFLPAENPWIWDRDTVANFVPHILVWLVSWMVWDQTGNWIVGEHDGTPEYHLTVLKASDQCWCRSGRKYFKCHLHFDQMEATRRLIRRN